MRSPLCCAGCVARGHPCRVARLRDELAPTQREIRERAGKVAEEFHETGFKISILLPKVFQAFRRAAAASQPLLDSLSDALDTLEESRPEESVAALEEANTRFGTFLGGINATRQRTLEAIVALQQSSTANSSPIRRAMRNARQAAKLIASGQLQEARRRQRTSQQDLLAAARAMRKRLDEIALPSGAEGSLLSRLLEEEAARHGLAWTIATRGEEFTEKKETPDAIDMPYPTAYRTLVRAYLRAITRPR